MDSIGKIVNLLINLGIFTLVVKFVFKTIKPRKEEKKHGNINHQEKKTDGIPGFFSKLEDYAEDLVDDEIEEEKEEAALYQGYFYQEEPTTLIEEKEKKTPSVKAENKENNAWIKEDRKITEDFGREIMEDEISGNEAYSLEQEALVHDLMSDPKKAYIYSEIFSKPKWKL